MQTEARPASAQVESVGSRGVVFINGEYVPAQAATLNMFDSGFMMGANVFDTLACWQGWLFKTDAHVERFYRSAHAIRVQLPYSKEALKDIIIETTRRAGLPDAYVQVIATRGVRAAGSPLDWPPTVICYSIPYIWAVGGPDSLNDGVRILVARTRNFPIESLDPKIKSFNRLNGYMAKLEALDADVDDVVMLDTRGFLTEGRGANVFLVRDGVLYTPSEDVLWGITRETVFEIAAALGLRAEFAWLSPYDLYNADEAFFCTTAGGITPIVEVDRRTVADGQPGPITRRVAERYWAMHTDPRYAIRVLGG